MWNQTRGPVCHAISACFVKNSGFVCLKNSIILHEDKTVCNLKKKKKNTKTKPQRRHQEQTEIVLLVKRHQQHVLIFMIYFLAMEQRWSKNSQRDFIFNYFVSFLSLSAKVYSSHLWQLSFTHKVAILTPSSPSIISLSLWLQCCWDFCCCNDTWTTIQC